MFTTVSNWASFYTESLHKMRKSVQKGLILKNCMFSQTFYPNLQKNFTREKIFDFEIFGLKYVLKHSESIPTKKKFSTKIF